MAVEISTRAGLAIAAVLIGGYLVVTRVRERPASPPEPARSLPPAVAQSAASPPVAATVAAQVAPTTPPASSTLTFAGYGLRLDPPAEWSCRKTELTSDTMVDVQCVGGGHMRVQVTQAGDDKSIDDFDAHVLAKSPDLVRAKARHTFGGHKVLVWGETSQTEATAGGVFYARGYEITVSRRGSLLDSIADLRRAVESVSLQ